MNWLSLDPAAKSGLVFWQGAEPVTFATLRPASAKEAKGLDRERAVTFTGTTPRTYPRELEAWRGLLANVSAVVVEESFGDSPKTVSQMGERRGYVRCVCDSLGIAFSSISTREWRRVCGERLGMSWPTASKAAKQRSIDLVREHCGGLEVTGDEGDAYWLGRAALWLGLISGL